MWQPFKGVTLPAEASPPPSGVSTPPSTDNIRRWAQWTVMVSERLPLPFTVIVFLAALVVAAEQFLEFTMEGGSVANATPDTLSRLSRYLILPLLTLYMPLTLRTLKASAVRHLAELRPAVRIDDDEYDSHVHRMVNTSRRIELTLLLVSLAGVVFWFVVVDLPLVSTSEMRASQYGAAAVLILIPYVIFGWAFLMLVYSAWQLGTALGTLAHRPIAVNIYDVGNLLPFGRIALIYSLSVAGVILILLIGLGRPTQVSSWVTIFLLSVASLAALIIPLRGVNQQMRDSRNAELERIHSQLGMIHDRVLDQLDLEREELGRLSDRASTLVNLRKVVLETPTWPYRDTLMIVRAFAVAIAPLLYFVLTQILAILLFQSQPR
jgi:hypothetical protein